MAAAAIRALGLTRHLGLVRPTAAATSWSATMTDVPAPAW
jgi:hypothetical protein